VPGNGHVIISDGGYAREQVEIFSRSESLLRSHYKEMEQIATRLGLKWDTEFSYTESDLDALVRRIPVLAEAASRALSLTRHRPRRRHGPLRDELRAELRDLGLGVKSRAKIALTKDLPTVTVDFEVRNGSAAAVEVLSSRTAAGSLIAVDRAVANFHVLDRGGYAGRLFAVYDEASPAGEPTARNRFIAAAPETAVLVAGAEAAPTIERELKAAH
jgi:hypothetical protein